MKLKKIFIGLLALTCFVSVPASIEAATGSGTFSFNLKPNEFDYSEEVVRDTNKGADYATAIVERHYTPSNCVLNLRVTDGTKDGANLCSEAVTVMENASYEMEYTKKIEKSKY